MLLTDKLINVADTLHLRERFRLTASSRSSRAREIGPTTKCTMGWS